MRLVSSLFHMRAFSTLIVLLLVYSLAVTIPAAAQDAVSDAKLLEELTKLEKASWEAAMKDDKEFFRSYLAPESKWFLADGSVIGRDQVLLNLDDFHLQSYSMGKVSMLKVTEDSVMIMYNIKYQGLHQGIKESFAELESSSLYVRRDGKWLEIFYQETAKTGANQGSAEDAKALVAKAISLYKKEGKAAFSKITSGEDGLRDRDLYVWAHSTGEKPEVVAYGGPTLKTSPIGRPATEIVGFACKPIGKIVQEQATEDGSWVDYQWLNPTTGKPEQKFSWIVRSGDHIFGCGIYASHK